MFSTNLLLLLVFTLTIKKTLIKSSNHQFSSFSNRISIDIFDISYLVFMVQLKDLSLSKINSIQVFEDFKLHILCTDLGNLQSAISTLRSP